MDWEFYDLLCKCSDLRSGNVSVWHRSNKFDPDSSVVQQIQLLAYERCWPYGNCSMLECSLAADLRNSATRRYQTRLDPIWSADHLMDAHAQALPELWSTQLAHIIITCNPYQTPDRTPCIDILGTTCTNKIWNPSRPASYTEHQIELLALTLLAQPAPTSSRTLAGTPLRSYAPGCTQQHQQTNYWADKPSNHTSTFHSQFVEILRRSFQFQYCSNRICIIPQAPRIHHLLTHTNLLIHSHDTQSAPIYTRS